MTGRKEDRIVLLVRFQTKPGKTEFFLQQLRALVKTMSAESNFVDFVIHHNIDKPEEIIVYETWLGTRETFLKEELPRAYRKPYEETLSEFVENRSVEWLIPLHS